MQFTAKKPRLTIFVSLAGVQHGGVWPLTCTIRYYYKLNEPKIELGAQRTNSKSDRKHKLQQI